MLNQIIPLLFVTRTYSILPTDDMCSSLTIVNNTVLHIPKWLRVRFKSYHKKKLSLHNVTDTNWNYHDHCALYTHIESLCGTSELKLRLHVYYTSI